MTTNVDARLRVCHPCLVEWRSAAPCWHCGQPGTLTPSEMTLRKTLTPTESAPPNTTYETRVRNELGQQQRQAWGAPPAVEGRPA